MEPMTAALILAGVGAGVGYLGGERQKKAQEKAQEQFRKDTAEQERKALIASAYGLGGVAPAQMQAPTADPLMTAMQGGLAGAQFATMNPNLWGGGGATAGGAGLTGVPDVDTAKILAQQDAGRQLAAQQSLRTPDYYGMDLSTTFDPTRTRM